MRYFASFGSTVDEMLEQAPSVPSTSEVVETPSTDQSTADIARKVIQGLWENGSNRVSRLSNAEYESDAVQQEVNRILSSDELEVDLDEIAWQVIQGDWGNGGERQARLESAGYDYQVVQQRVNELLE